MIKSKDTNNSIYLLRAKCWAKNFTCVTSHHVQNTENTIIISLCCCSVIQLCPILCNLMDCSTPGFPLSPRACSNSCPLSQENHPTISSSVVPFSSCLQSFPVSGSFLMNRLFTSSGQSIGVSASVLQMNIKVDFL